MVRDPGLVGRRTAGDLRRRRIQDCQDLNTEVKAYKLQGDGGKYGERSRGPCESQGSVTNRTRWSSVCLDQGNQVEIKGDLGLGSGVCCIYAECLESELCLRYIKN
jgi:hypothetical protein